MKTDEVVHEGELVDLKTVDATAMFENGGVRDAVAIIRSATEGIVFDVEDPEERKACAALARKVARSKVALDTLGKDHVAKLKAATKAIDGDRKWMRDNLDSLRDEIRKPLDIYEEEQARLMAEVMEKIQTIRDLEVVPPDLTSDQIATRIADVKAIVFDDRIYRLEQSDQVLQDSVIEHLTAHHEATLAAEAQQAELEKLREQQAEAQAKARDAALAALAAQHAREQALAENEAALRLAEQEKQEAQAQALAAEDRAKQAQHLAEVQAKAEQRMLEEEKAQRAADDQRRQDMTVLIKNVLDGMAPLDSRAIAEAIVAEQIPYVRVEW